MEYLYLNKSTETLALGTHPLTWIKPFSPSHCARTNHPNQLASTCQSQQYTLTSSPQASVSSPALCHHMVQTELGSPHSVTLVHHRVMLTESDE